MQTEIIVTDSLRVLRSACWSVLNVVNNRKYMTAGEGQGSDWVTWCASYLLNASGDPGGIWRPCSSPLSTHISCLLWKLLWVYLRGIFQADESLFGPLNEPPWSFHELSWDRSVVIFGTAAWAVLSTDHALVTGCLCSGQLGELGAGLAAAQGTCNPGSGLQTKWHLGIPTMLG